MKEAILENIRDLNWWFTVIFAGLIVGLFANYLKDWTYRLFGHFSRRFRIWKEDRDRHREERIELLVANPHLLMIEYVCCVYAALQFAALFLLYISLPMLGAAFQQFQLESGDFAYGDPRLVLKYFIYFSPVCGLMAIRYEFRLLGLMSVCARARRQYEDAIKNGRTSNNALQATSDAERCAASDAPEG